MQIGYGVDVGLAEVDPAGDVVLLTNAGLAQDCPTSAGPSRVQKRRGSDGSCVWTSSGPLVGGVTAPAIAVDGVGAVYLGGLFVAPFEFAGAVLTPTSAKGGAYVVKYDAGGNQVWGRSWGSPYPALAGIVQMAVAADQSVWMVGQYKGPLTLGAQTLQAPHVQPFLALLTPGGDVVTAAAVSTAMPAFDQQVVGGVALVAEPAGTLVLAARVPAGDLSVGGGMVTVPAAGSLLLAKLDTAAGLAPVWAHVAGSGITGGIDGTGQFPNVLRLGSCGNVFVTGWFSGTLDLGCGAMTAQTPPNPEAWGDLFFGKIGP